MYLLTYQVRICVFWYLVGTRLTFIVKIIFNLYIIFFLAINCPSQVGEIVGIVLRRIEIVVLASCPCPCWNTGEIFVKNNTCCCRDIYFIEKIVCKCSSVISLPVWTVKYMSQYKEFQTEKHIIFIISKVPPHPMYYLFFIIIS